MGNLRGLIAAIFVAFAGECLMLAEGATAELRFTPQSEVRKRKALARRLQQRLAQRQKAHKALGLLKLSKAEQKEKDEKEKKERDIKEKQQQEHIQLQLLTQGRAPEQSASAATALLSKSSKVTTAAEASVSQASPMQQAKHANNLKHNLAFKIQAHRSQKKVWGEQKHTVLNEESDSEARKLSLAKRTNGQAAKKQWKIKLSKKLNQNGLFEASKVRTESDSLNQKRQRISSRLQHRQDMMKRHHAR
eukprot:TRINITY_DN562_c0_g1_i1.p1 TRINITY_DN562_c0_g1~~TRINITY_DN562_c0_g1_i1.p1  ORF type:complete len:248 (-),score=73.74 TRINITY_DN562_c0_g1_i1:137-880(-)